MGWAGVFASGAAPGLVKAGVGLIALGGVVVAAVLHRRGHAARQEPALHASTREVARWHLAELERQRELLSNVPRWYLGPFVPGVLVVLAGAWRASPEQGPRVGLTALAMAAVFLGVAALNRRAARQLGERIDALRRSLEG